MIPIIARVPFISSRRGKNIRTNHSRTWDGCRDRVVAWKLNEIHVFTDEARWIKRALGAEILGQIRFVPEDPVCNVGIASCDVVSEVIPVVLEYLFVISVDDSTRGFKTITRITSRPGGVTVESDHNLNVSCAHLVYYLI